MKKLIVILLAGLASWSCTDNCRQTRTYRATVPYSFGQEQIRTGIGVESPRDLENPGKIYAYGNYLLIGENKKVFISLTIPIFPAQRNFHF